MLGQALSLHLPDHDIEVVRALARQDCSILDQPGVEKVLRDLKPDLVFNAAAYTNVDKAEDEPDECFRINANGPETLARACATSGAKLIHYSTDFVFDGELERPYAESDTTSPQGVYARSKLAGEERIRAAGTHAFVLRVGCLYGRGGRNFPSTILRRLRAGETIRAEGERLGSPTWVKPVVSVSAELARTEHFGLYHATAAGETSWAEYARFLTAALNLPASQVEILPTSALSLRAPRPRRAVLDNKALRSHALDSLGDWQTQARAYLASEPT
jgi:dTDP-4-dehydrorhamnose reductase